MSNYSELPPMVVDFEYKGDVCVLRLKGRILTGSDAGYLRVKSDELKASGYRKVLADFRHVPYVDSTGIGFLVAVYTSMRNCKGRFVMANLNPRVREVLDLTRLAEILTICDDEAGALAALNAPARKQTAGDG
jgi:anti-anti-sigma factor